jgi:CheY-like chemotaxis protein
MHELPLRGNHRLFSMASTPPATERSRGQRVHDMLERQGLPRHKHSPFLANLLDLSYSTAHRKLQGSSPWTLDELQVLASHCGEPLASLIEAAPSEVESDSVLALLQAGSLRISCRVWLGGRVPRPADDSLIAFTASGRWRVGPADESNRAEAFAVRKLVIEPARERQNRIAVLDDDRDLAETMALHLREAGYEAVPYFTIDALMNDFQEQRYEGYIIDWIVGRSHAGQLTQAIRAHDPKTPIAVLTDRAESDVAVESEVAAAVASCNLLFFEKPVRMPIISAALMRAFAET